MDRGSKALYYRAAFVGGLVDLDIVQGYTQADGSRTEVTTSRRMNGKKFRRKGFRTIIDLADIDREALKQQYPFETFTVADFPELFTGHVNRRIPEGVGQVMKVPLTWIGNSGGFWTYAGPKVLAGVPGMLQTVYRGTQADNGAIVNALEYVTGTATGASSGIVVNTVRFGREQVGFDGQPYLLTADYLLPGSRAAADEAARILTRFAISSDGTTFGASAGYDLGTGIFIDTLYGGDTDGKAGNAIIEDLLRVARGWMIPGSLGTWALVADIPQVSSLQIDTSTDRATIDEWGDDPDLAAQKVTIEYRPKVSNREEYLGKLPPRITSGAAAEKVLSFPYVYEHAVADRLGSYYAKLEVLKRGSGSIKGMQTNSGQVITATDANTLLGTSDLFIAGVTRAADRNDWKLREYNPDLYVYTAGTLPADATTGYSPDYSFTAPLAPTGLTVVSQGTAVDADGKITSFAVIRATPPAVNWQRLMVQVKNTATGEIKQAQLILTGGNYETTIADLRPNQAHTVVGWAVNSNGIDGITSSPVSFTSATNTNVPTTPTPAAIGQTYTRELDYSWAASTPGSGAPPIKEYVIEESVGGGAFSQVQVVAAPLTTYKRVGLTVGNSVQMRVKARDRIGNESAYATSGSVTVQQMLTDAYMANAGISGISIANSSINGARTSTSSGSTSGTVGNGGGTVEVSFSSPDFTFFIAPTCTPSFSHLTMMVPNASSSVCMQNNTAANPMSYSVAYRNLS